MEKLKKFRQSKMLSQEKMARAMDVTLSYYSQVERGKVLCGVGFIIKAKRAFPEIDINDMFFSNVLNNSQRGGADAKYSNY